MKWLMLWITDGMKTARRNQSTKEIDLKNPTQTDIPRPRGKKPRCNQNCGRIRDNVFTKQGHSDLNYVCNYLVAQAANKFIASLHKYPSSTGIFLK
jgi:hypothetical protein